MFAYSICFHTHFYFLFHQIKLLKRSSIEELFALERRLRTFVSKTHMEYSSRGYLDKNAVSFFSNNVDQLGETLVYQFGVTPPSPPAPPQTSPPAYDEDPLASTVHQLSFDSHNDRLLEAWLLKQIQDKTTVPITLWSFNGPLGGDKDGEVRHLFPPSHQLVLASYKKYRT